MRPGLLFERLRIYVQTFPIVASWLAVLVWLQPIPASGQVAEAPSLAIRGGMLIDGTGRAPWPGVVVVQGDRISCVGTETDCPLPPETRVLEVAGRFLLPGFIDTHVHLHWTSDSLGTSQVQQLRFAHGITTVREAGTKGEQESNLAQRQNQAPADRPTPRVLVAGVLKAGDSSAADIESLSDQVRRLADLGVDAIKIKDPLPPEDLIAAGKVARSIGLPVFGHVSTGGQPAGQGPDAPEAFDGVSHMFSIAPAAILAPQELAPRPGPLAEQEAKRIWQKNLWLAADPAALRERIRALVARRSWLEPLLLSEERFVHPVDVAAIDGDFVNFGSRYPDGIPNQSRSPAEQERLEEVLVRVRAFVLAFHEAGGMVVAGTDNDPIPGLSFHQELEALVASGLPSAAAIAAGTRNAAMALGVGEQMGTIEPGKLADLVILDSNPLRDIRETRRAWRVVKAGVVHDPAPLLASLRREARALYWSNWAKWLGRRRVVVPAGAVVLALVAGFLLRRRSNSNEAGA